MDVNIATAEAAFRAEIRSFLAEAYPRDILEKVRRGQVLDRDDHLRSQRALQSRGWLAPHWPAVYGGPGWDAVRRHVFEDELDRAGVPNLLPMAIIYIGPVIYTFGTEEQKRRWLPDILASRAMWAQGYSEPEAGSDLAALTFRADRDGEHYVLNGTKIWTSYAQWADWIFCLARTSREARRQDGISLICCEMSAPGVTVHPIISIDGLHHLNRVEFQDVRVPVTQRIGEEGRGWHYATFLLQNERLSYAHVSRKLADLRHLRLLASAMASDNPDAGDGRVINEPGFAARIARCEIDTQTLGVFVQRILTAGEAATVAQVSALKIFATETAQAITELSIDLAGRYGSVHVDRHHPDWADAAPLVPSFAVPAMASYMTERAQTIYGGATEVQKNIIWKNFPPV